MIVLLKKYRTTSITHIPPRQNLPEMIVMRVSNDALSSIG